MVKKALYAAVLLGVACQAIVGIDDKQLDPKYSSGGTSAEGGDVVTTGPSGLDPRPPPRPSGTVAPSGKGATRWFAAQRIFLGTVDPSTKKKNVNAWKGIGHNIDGECTTLEISNSDTSATCKKPDQASEDSLADGDDCRDNATGRLLSLASQYLSQDFELGLQAKLYTADTATYLLKLEDLDEGADDPYVPGALYVTVPRGPTDDPPLWNGSDLFNVDVRTVNLTPPDSGSDAGAGLDAAADAKLEAGPTADAAKDAPSDAPADVKIGPNSYIDQPRYVFPKGYLKNNIWVSGDFGKSPIALPMFVLDRLAVVSTETLTLVVELSKTHDKAVSSMLSAVVSTDTLQNTFAPVALEITGCSAFVSALLMSNFILPGRDLGSTLPNFQNPTQQCQSESIGFGFEWSPVKPPLYVIPSSEPPPKCGGDAGF